MSDVLQRIFLDGRAVDYVRSQVDASVLGSRVAEHVNMSVGRAWTVLPETTPQARAYAFSTGEILSANQERRINRTVPMVEVVSLLDELFDFVDHEISAAGKICLVEHPLLKAGERPDFLRELAIDVADTVWLTLTAGQDRSRQKIAFRSSLMPWRGVGAVCARPEQLPPGDLPAGKFLDQCLLRVTSLFSVAYDGEGFVVVDLPPP